MGSVTRTYDINLILQATEQYSKDIEGFYPKQWIQNPLNIALINSNQDVGLFENQYKLEKTVCGHYFFFSRGKEAIKAAQEFLEEVFTNTYIETIIGLTPLDHKGALWLNRKLGFKENGEISTAVGPCKFVLLTKEQWKDLNK